MSDCPYAGNTWMMSLRCKFEPRYDTEPSRLSIGESRGIDAEELEALAKQYQRVTYVQDVCVKCGKTADRIKP